MLRYMAGNSVDSVKRFGKSGGVDRAMVPCPEVRKCDGSTKFIGFFMFPLCHLDPFVYIHSEPCRENKCFIQQDESTIKPITSCF